MHHCTLQIVSASVRLYATLDPKLASSVLQCYGNCSRAPLCVVVVLAACLPLSAKQPTRVESVSSFPRNPEEFSYSTYNNSAAQYRIRNMHQCGERTFERTQKFCAIYTDSNLGAHCAALCAGVRMRPFSTGRFDDGNHDIILNGHAPGAHSPHIMAFHLDGMMFNCF